MNNIIYLHSTQQTKLDLLQSIINTNIILFKLTDSTDYLVNAQKAFKVYKSLIAVKSEVTTEYRLKVA